MFGVGHECVPLCVGINKVLKFLNLYAASPFSFSLQVHAQCVCQWSAAEHHVTALHSPVTGPYSFCRPQHISACLTQALKRHCAAPCLPAPCVLLLLQAFPHGSAAMQPSTTPSHGPTITEKVQAGSSDLYNKAKDTAAAAGTTIKETVAPSHPTTTTSSSTTPSTAAHQQGPTLTQKVQAAQAQLYSKAANTASAAGEAIKGTIASADQGTTTKLRDATAAVGEKAVAALSGTADGGVGLATQAGGLLTQAKETVKVGAAAGGVGCIEIGMHSNRKTGVLSMASSCICAINRNCMSVSTLQAMCAAGVFA
jgi:hypothetical protein